MPTPSVFVLPRLIHGVRRSLTGLALDPLAADQISLTNSVQIRTYENQGTLLPPVPLTNGATFRVGIRFLSGRSHSFPITTQIAYRPDWQKPGAPGTHTFTP